MYIHRYVCVFVCLYVRTCVPSVCLAIDDDDESDSDDESGDQESGGGQLFDDTASSGSDLDLDDEGQPDLAAGGGGAQRVRQKSDGSHSDLFASSASGDSDLSDSEAENSGKPSGEVANGGQGAVS